jgi:hypothetical protein
MPKKHSGVIDGDDSVVAAGARQNRVEFADDGAINIYARRLEFRATEVPIQPKPGEQKSWG